MYTKVVRGGQGRSGAFRVAQTSKCRRRTYRERWSEVLRGGQGHIQGRPDRQAQNVQRQHNQGCGQEHSGAPRKASVFRTYRACTGAGRGAWARAWGIDRIADEANHVHLYAGWVRGQLMSYVRAFTCKTLIQCVCVFDDHATSNGRALLHAISDSVASD